jgi:hypothetical protein
MNQKVQKTKQQVVEEMRKYVKLELIVINLSTVRQKMENTMPQFLILNEMNKNVTATSGSLDNLANTAEAEADEKDNNTLFDPKNDVFVVEPIK